MVRINIIEPKYLADQHLIAEYNEILMLEGYIKKYPMTNKNNIPKKYCLGKGHMLFFKNKTKYLKERHENIKIEMKKRNFKPEKTLSFLKKHLTNNEEYKETNEDKKIIKERILKKIKEKPNFYKYYKENKSFSFFKKLIDKA